MFGKKQNYLTSLVVFAIASGLPGFTVAETKVITYAFSDADPPTSFADEHGEAKGLLPDLVELVFEAIPEYDVELKAYPWARAKFNVEHDLADGLFTYPGKSVSEYAAFTESPAYLIDYNYIFYRLDNPSYEKLTVVTTAEDLKSFVMVTDSIEDGNESWEEENLPREQYPRYFVPNMEAGFNLMALRNVGDYAIRNPEEAMFMVRKLGYEDQLEFHRVEFPVENTLPFHLGIRLSHPEHEKLMQELNRVVDSPEFQARAFELIKSYH